MTHKLEKAALEQKRKTKQEIQPISGILGIVIGNGRTVEVPNRNAFVYVRLRNNQSEVIQAYNNQVSPSYNLPVLVERHGNKYVVIGVDTERYENNWNSYSPYLPRHGNTHSFDPETGGGGDIVWVHPRQFMPLLVLPSGSAGSPNVIVAPYTLKNADGTWRYVGNTGTSSFSPYRPTSATGAVMALVYLNTDDGNPYFIVNSGSVFSSTLTGTSQVYPFIPTVTETSWIPLAAVRLITGTSQISWDNLYHVGQFLHNMPSGTGGGGSITVQDEGVSQGTATTFNFVGANVQATVSGGTARVFITGSAGGVGIDTGTLDSRYLKLDASNDPVTGGLRIVTSPSEAADQTLEVVNTNTNKGGLFVNSVSGSWGFSVWAKNNFVGYFSQIIGAGQTVNHPIVLMDRLAGGSNSQTLKPFLELDDSDDTMQNYGGTLRHFISGSSDILRLNPQATGTIIPYVFNTQYAKPTGSVLSSWQAQGVEKAYVDISGTFHSNGTPLVKEAPVDGVQYARKNAGWVEVESSGGGISPHAPGGRLSLLTGTPVSTSDLTAKTSIYYIPYVDEYYSSYNGTWSERAISPLTLNLDNDSGHTGFHASGTNYDLFLYNDGGTDRLLTGPAWTNATTRSTLLERKNGALTNAASMTGRFGTGAGDTVTVSQNQGMYVGTFRTTLAGQTEFSAQRRLLWNMYNRKRFSLERFETTNSWSVTNTAAFAPMNGSTSNRVELVMGIQEDYVNLEVAATILPTTNGFGGAAIGEDSTTQEITDYIGYNMQVNVANAVLPTYKRYSRQPFGYHYYQALQICNAATLTMFGKSPSAPILRNSGIVGEWWG